MEATHWWGPHAHGFWLIPLIFMIVMCLLVGLMAPRAGGWRCGVGRIGPGHYGWREDVRCPSYGLDETDARDLAAFRRRAQSYNTSPDWMSGRSRGSSASSSFTADARPCPSTSSTSHVERAAAAQV